jgi:hypothetical protein
VIAFGGYRVEIHKLRRSGELVSLDRAIRPRWISPHDVEAVFLYPWAVAYRHLGLYAFVEAVIFLAILGVGYVYAWRKRAMEWL